MFKRLIDVFSNIVTNLNHFLTPICTIVSNYKQLVHVLRNLIKCYKVWSKCPRDLFKLLRH